jgi:putative DNA primase/helicase
MMLTARDLAARHNLKRIGREWRGRCPACGYPNGLTLSEKAGRPLWWCASCRDQAAVSAALLGDAVAPRGDDTRRPADASEDRKAAALRLWQAAGPAAGSPVAIYLQSRGLTLPPEPVLRLLAGAKHPTGARLPAMVALLADLDGKPAAVHRTFLAPGGTGKATVEPQRMTLGPVRGAAVRLWPAAPRLVIGEGIETSLAAAVLLKAPAWAAVSAGNLADTLALPALVREVVIAADNDAPGRRAARQAAARWRAEGRAVKIAMPDRPGTDFNDLLRERARHG